MVTITPYGHWPSPLPAAVAAAGRVSLSEVCSDGTSLYWLESRPSDGGRIVFVRAAGGAVADISPAGVSIRSRVHEYGGGAVCLVPGHGPGAFAYVEQTSQRVWLSQGAADPLALTDQAPDGERWTHGGLGASADGEWVLAVREVFGAGVARPRRSIVALGTRSDRAGESVLLGGHDFYGAPALSPGGDRVAAVVWDHPDMPWDRSRLEVTAVAGRTDPASGTRRLVPEGSPWSVAGGDDESVGQPRWRRDGSLRFMSDRAGWWQPFTHPGTDAGVSPRPETSDPAEYHGADFVLRLSTHTELPDGTAVARRSSAGLDSLVTLGGPDHPPRTLDQPCTAISGLCAHGDGIAFIGSTPDAPPAVWTMASLDQPAQRAVPSPRPAALAPHDVAVGEPFVVTGRSGRAVHGAWYPPTLRGAAGPPGRLPPLVVYCHGGPTSSAGAGFDVTVQYFTSRGFAVATVDYAGSTGYGRAFRCALWGQWGVADAEDCADAARHLARAGRVDGSRLAIRGTSAGGLTALNALASGGGFAAAASWYGVTDLLALAASTHDFEAHYTDRLIGPLPESRTSYLERSPVQRAADLTGSVLLLQGLDDAVVPPAQAERLRDALVAEGRTCRTSFFAGEGHGFRRAETVTACLEQELAFYLEELRL